MSYEVVFYDRHMKEINRGKLDGPTAHRSSIARVGGPPGSARASRDGTRFRPST